MISIICPVYKTEKFLNQCIESIYNQSFKDWELIIINDCSPDNSLQIVNKWLKKDKRIKLINHNTNKGVDQARFTGLNNSKGEYIMFVDSDDWITKDALSLLIQKINDEKSDIVYGSIVKVMDKFGLINVKTNNNYSKEQFTQAITVPQLFDDYFISYFGVNKLRVSVWAKLYRRSVIEKANLQPSSMKMGEDLIFNLKLHPYLTKISFIKETVYAYRYGGMTSKTNPTLLEDLKYQYLLKKDFIKKYKYDKATPFIKIELINVFYSYLKSLFLVSNKTIDEVKQFVINELEDPVYDECVNNIKFEHNYEHKHELIRQRKVNAIVDLALAEAKSDKNSYLVKRVLSKILN